VLNRIRRAASLTRVRYFPKGRHRRPLRLPLLLHPLTSQRSSWTPLSTERVTGIRSGVRTPHLSVRTFWLTKNARDGTRRLSSLPSCPPTPGRLS
jgi:hypothetical protein